MHKIRKATAAVALLALPLAAAPAGAADRGTDRLLNAYPLEQRPATVAGAPARGPTAAPAPRTGTSDPPRLTQGAALAVAAGTMLLAGLLLTRRRPRLRAALATSPAAADPPASPSEPAFAPVPPAPSRAAPTARAMAPAAEPTAPAEPSRPGRGAAAATLERPAPARPAAAMPAKRVRAGVLCQVRWLEDGDASRFAAVTLKGRERATIAVSPAFAWDGPEPPPHGAEPHAALQTLADELLATGWRPVRGRGREHGAPRWYARRFLLPPVGAEPRPPDEPMDAPEGGLA